MLSLPKAWVQSLVEELRSHKLCGAVKKIIIIINKINKISFLVEQKLKFNKISCF